MLEYDFLLFATHDNICHLDYTMLYYTIIIYTP